MTNEQILREALENICKHIETIAGDMTRHSGAYAIAKAALKATEPQEKCDEPFCPKCRPLERPYEMYMPKAGDPQIIDGMAQHTGGGTSLVHHHEASQTASDPHATWPIQGKVKRIVT